MLLTSVHAATETGYVDDARNDIKALTPDEVQGLKQGQGMGFAKAAELNRYPGPRHVLDLADQLHLSGDQRDETLAIFEQMREQAVGLGTRPVEYERQLDTLFASARVSPSNLDSLLLRIGETRARLRGVHLRAHLEMKRVLSPHQVVMYDRLRGYGQGAGSHKHSH